ncbi:hypothetical protein V8C35DRAFT_299568 [Trichoderma chlorosporum]
MDRCRCICSQASVLFGSQAGAALVHREASGPQTPGRQGVARYITERTIPCCCPQRLMLWFRGLAICLYSQRTLASSKSHALALFFSLDDMLRHSTVQGILQTAAGSRLRQRLQARGNRIRVIGPQRRGISLASEARGMGLHCCVARASTGDAMPCYGIPWVASASCDSPQPAPRQPVIHFLSLRCAVCKAPRQAQDSGDSQLRCRTQPRSVCDVERCAQSGPKGVIGSQSCKRGGSHAEACHHTQPHM